MATWFKRMLWRGPRVTQQGFPETQACVCISRNKSGMYLSHIGWLMGCRSVRTHGGKWIVLTACTWMYNFDVYLCALCRNVSQSVMCPWELLLTGDFSRETSPGGSENHHESQPTSSAHFPISLTQLFREVLKRAPDVSSIFVSLTEPSRP